MADDEDDIEVFLAEINAGIAHINPVITIDLTKKRVHCYLCDYIVEVDVSYRLSDTCPSCFAKLREQYLKVHGYSG